MTKPDKFTITLPDPISTDLRFKKVEEVYPGKKVSWLSQKPYKGAYFLHLLDDDTFEISVDSYTKGADKLLQDYLVGMHGPFASEMTDEDDPEWPNWEERAIQNGIEKGLKITVSSWTS